MYTPQVCGLPEHTLEVVGGKEIRKKEKKEKKVMNNVSGLRRRIFGVWQRSMGSALSDCPMHYEGDRLLQ